MFDFKPGRENHESHGIAAEQEKWVPQENKRFKRINWIRNINRTNAMKEYKIQQNKLNKWLDFIQRIAH